MKVERCHDGHFFDRDIYSECPYCAREKEKKNSSEATIFPPRFRSLGNISKIGKGSVGTVYKISGEKNFAIKVIECGKDKIKYQNALHELHIMAKLQNRTTFSVKLCDYEIENTDGNYTFYMLEEYHVPLSDFLSTHSLTSEEIIRLIIGICTAVAECVKIGILHCDIQPKNIFVDNLSSIKIGDFSSSLEIKHSRANDLIRGTLGYMAPEVYQKKGCSELSDLYSVGVILYSLFNSQTLPFMDTDEKELAVYKRLAGTTFPPINCKDKEFEKKLNLIIQTACAYEKENRYTNLELMIADLYELLALSKKTSFSPELRPDLKKVLPVIYIVQMSGRMANHIDDLNYIIRETSKQINEKNANKEIEIRTSILKYGGKPEWILFNKCIEDSLYQYTPRGLACIGPALSELNSKLTFRNINSLISPDSYLPIIIFISDGLMADDYAWELAQLKQNRVYERAIKIGFVINENNDVQSIEQIIGNSEAILSKYDVDIFRKIVNLISVSASVFSTDTTAKSILLGYSGDSFATSVLLGYSADSIATSAAIISSSSFVDSSKLTNSWDVQQWDVPLESQINSDTNDSLEITCVPLPETQEDSGKNQVEQLKKHGVCRICGTVFQQNSKFCPECGTKIIIEKPVIRLDRVCFSALAPKSFTKGEYSLVEVFMYEEEFRKVVEEAIQNADEDVIEKKSGVVVANKQARITVVLTSPDIEIIDNREEQIWQGEYLNFSFMVELPMEYTKKQILFVANVYVNDVIATRLKFITKCKSFIKQKVKLTREDILSVFVSYASQDRNTVARIVQGMRKARPELDIFFDVDSLRSGDDWESAMWKEIDNRDLLFLCWSKYARDSKWVDAEWRYALKNKGADCIEPVPIDPPNECPPPKELEKKHFNDRLLFIIQSDHTSDPLATFDGMFS